MKKAIKIVLAIVGCLAAIAGVAYLVMVGFDQIKQIHLGSARPEEYDDFADVE